jgi:hypothetical protein
MKQGSAEYFRLFICTDLLLQLPSAGAAEDLTE